MAQIRNNSLVKGISGALGKTVVFKNWQGKVIVANMPAKRRSLSAKQKASVQRFKAAGRYADSQMANDEAKAEYSKGTRPNKNAPYRVALSDYLNAPVVHYIKAPGYSGTPGDLISIKATDDFKVMTVHVRITNSAGTVLEQGEAVQNQRRPHMWKYRTTVVNPKVKGTVIKATAYDKPKNQGKGELTVDR